MRWSACASGVSVVLLAALGPVNAQTSLPPAPGYPSGQIPGQMTPGLPYSTPSSSTPGLPYSSPLYGSPSGTMPGTAAPSQMLPGAMAPTSPGFGSPSTAPSDPGFAAESRGEAGSDALASAAPQMIGDLIGGGAGAVFVSSTSTTRQTYYRSILAARSGIKIADNESPRPVDRGFATFNYFNGVNTFGAENFALYRGVIGFEKTFLDGQASFGMRLPIVQGNGQYALGTDGFGDLTMILKYAFYLDEATGDVASGGVAVSVPTGVDFRLVDGNVVSSVVLQPWGGFIYSLSPDLFTHGFTSLLVPTQSMDITIYTVDAGISYRLWRARDDGLLQAIVPTLETHLNIPFTSSSQDSLIYFPDLLMSITAGIHFGLGGNSWLTFATGIPVTGPRLYDAEFMSQLNVRF